MLAPARGNSTHEERRKAPARGRVNAACVYHCPAENFPEADAVGVGNRRNQPMALQLTSVADNASCHNHDDVMVYRRHKVAAVCRHHERRCNWSSSTRTRCYSSTNDVRPRHDHSIKNVTTKACKRTRTHCYVKNDFKQLGRCLSQVESERPASLEHRLRTRRLSLWLCLRHRRFHPLRRASLDDLVLLLLRQPLRKGARSNNTHDETARRLTMEPSPTTMARNLE